MEFVKFLGVVPMFTVSNWNWKRILLVTSSPISFVRLHKITLIDDTVTASNNSAALNEKGFCLGLSM